MNQKRLTTNGFDEYVNNNHRVTKFGNSHWKPFKGLPNMVTLLKIVFNKVLCPKQTSYQPESVNSQMDLMINWDNKSKGLSNLVTFKNVSLPSYLPKTPLYESEKGSPQHAQMDFMNKWTTIKGLPNLVTLTKPFITKSPTQNNFVSTRKNQLQMDLMNKLNNNFLTKGLPWFGLPFCNFGPTP